MRSSRIAIALLLFALVAAFAVPGAIACDKTNAAKAETASTANCDPAACAQAGCDPATCPKAAAAAATTASATTAQAGSCASKAAAETASATTAQAGSCASKAAAETASATTAQAGSCASKTAAAQTAGTTCTTGAATQTAGTAGCSKTTTAGAGCSGSQASAAKYDMAVETVKLPSGALAVMYRGNDADTVAMLHSAANGSAADFGCPNVQKMVASENCTVEMASTEDGLIFLCTSDDVALIESFQQNYEVAVAAPVEEVQGE